jgi:hypothetical protein
MHSDDISFFCPFCGAKISDVKAGEAAGEYANPCPHTLFIADDEGFELRFRRGAVVSFSREMADPASGAFDQFSWASGHPARLNFGDCMAYAVATVMRAPLLFKGGDFGPTDVMAHPASIRL